MVIQHREAINCIALSLIHKSLRWVMYCLLFIIRISYKWYWPCLNQIDRTKQLIYSSKRLDVI